VVQHALTWINAHTESAQFVRVHLYDPHDPYEPPGPLPKTYDAEVAYADSVVGELLGYLKKRHRMEINFKTDVTSPMSPEMSLVLFRIL
jgi:hypothetical protein